MEFLSRILKLSFICVSLFILPACNCEKADVSQESVSESQAKKKLVVVNVADLDTYNECHIKGSAQLDFGNVEGAFADVPRDTPIVTYCANYQCTASGAVAQMLKDMGFTNVKAFEAGIAEWYQKGYPVEGTCTHKDKSAVSSYLTAENKKHDDAEDDGIVIISIDQLKSDMTNAGLLA
ncbi:MAG TPA: rhodanese-like domain-containing protein [Candidatus Babeliales bacterium]|nr:rhodanese-like domain-containing protein [Candidatus Babeliales bacterium]